MTAVVISVIDYCEFSCSLLYIKIMFFVFVFCFFLTYNIGCSPNTTGCKLNSGSPGLFLVLSHQPACSVPVSSTSVFLTIYVPF